MTAEERKQFDALQAEVALLRNALETIEKLHHMPCPDWARPAIEAAQLTIGPDGNPIVIRRGRRQLRFLPVCLCVASRGTVQVNPGRKQENKRAVRWSLPLLSFISLPLTKPRPFRRSYAQRIEGD